MSGRGFNSTHKLPLTAHDVCAACRMWKAPG